MVGLLLKDLLNLKKNIKSLLFITVFYIVIFSMSGDASFLSGVMIFIFSMQFIGSFSYDDIAKWDKYALSLPVTRKEVVRSKYILALIFVLLGAVASLIMDLIFRYLKPSTNTMNIQEGLLTIYSILAVAIIFISVLLPLIYKFGVERSRIMIISCTAVPFLFFYLLNKLGVGLPSEETLMLIMKMSPFIILLILYLSYMASCNIYSKKEM